MLVTDILLQSESLPFSLVYLMLLVVPGVLGIQLYFRAARETDSHDRLKAVVYSVTLSIGSLLILYLLSAPFLDPFVNVSEGLGNRFGFPIFADINDLSLPVLVAGYLVHILTSGLMGYSMGSLRYRRRSDDTDPREAWDFAFGEVYGGSERVQVVTEDGEIFEGVKNQMAHSLNSRDILLSSVMEVQVNDEREEIGRVQVAPTVYIDESNIRRVLFIEDEDESDPDAERQDEAESIEDLDSFFEDLEESSISGMGADVLEEDVEWIDREKLSDTDESDED